MKRILSTLSDKWPEYLLEVIVLVVGIYGAFALENWNENNNAAKSTQSLIQNLNEEIIQNQQVIDQAKTC